MDKNISDVELSDEEREQHLIAFGVMAAKSGDYEHAILSYDKAIELNPNNSEVYFLRGVAYFELQNYEQAYSDFDKAVKLNPNDLDSRKNLEIISKMIENNKIAEKIMQKEFEFGDFEYKIRRDGIIITGYYGDDEIVEIPSVINGRDVLYIGEEVFKENKYIHSIIFPENLKEIGHHAFWKCENLISLELPESLNKICEDAFSGCENLNYVKLPKNLNVIFCGVFSHCENLKEIELNEGLKKIDEEAFSGSGLEKIFIHGGVKNICDKAFWACKNLKYVEIKTGVEKIGDEAFWACKKLENVILPYVGLKEIGKNIFSYCENLKEIQFPTDLEEITECMFGYCKNLEKVDLPKSLKKISQYAFRDCENLKRVNLPDGLQEISEGAFYNCNSLEFLKVPAAAKIDKYFSSENLGSIAKETVGSNYLYYTSINLINKDTGKLIEQEKYIMMADTKKKSIPTATKNSSENVSNVNQNNFNNSATNNSGFDIGDIILSVAAYFFMIFAFSWIGEKFFYDFDRAALLLFDGHFFKGICTLLIMAFVYYIAAAITVEMDGGKIATILIILFLLYSLGSDIYEFYNNSDDVLAGISISIGYLIVSSDDVLKLFTLFSAISRKNNIL